MSLHAIKMLVFKTPTGATGVRLHSCATATLQNKVFIHTRQSTLFYKARSNQFELINALPKKQGLVLGGARGL